MPHLKQEDLDSNTHKYSVIFEDEPISYNDALRLWIEDAEFRDLFISALVDSPFSAYRWESPPVTRGTVTRDFEFVLVNSPGLERTPNSSAFSDHFVEGSASIAVFENLGGDALLIVPSPRALSKAYGHLAAFARSAPSDQNHEQWTTIGQTVQQRLGDQPIWVSTAGAGVPWLHVRLDSSPKYYAHTPYRVSA